MKCGSLLLCALSLGIAWLNHFEGFIAAACVFVGGMNLEHFAEAWAKRSAQGEGNG